MRGRALGAHREGGDGEGPRGSSPRSPALPTQRHLLGCSELDQPGGWRPWGILIHTSLVLGWWPPGHSHLRLRLHGEAVAPGGCSHCVPNWVWDPGCSHWLLSPSSPGPGSGWKLERVVKLEHLLRQLLPGPAAAHTGVQRALIWRCRVPGPLGREQRLLPAAVPRSGPHLGPVGGDPAGASRGGGVRPVGANCGPWRVATGV